MSSSCVFLGEDHFCFLDRKVISYLQEKETPSLPNIQKLSYFHVFCWERWSSIFHLKNKIISGKRNIIFSNNTRKIVFQCDFFGERRGLSFQNIWKIEKMVFSVGCFLGSVDFVVFVFASYEKPWREFKSKVLRDIIIAFENSCSTYRPFISRREPFALRLHWQ